LIGLRLSINVCIMSTQEIAEAVMELPETERLELARRIVASIVAEQETAGAIGQAVQGIEDVVTGKVRGLSEAEFRDALQ
jgi:hypothetical protein